MTLESRLLATLVATISLTLPSVAQIHVDPTGSDATGDGTAANPYKTITFSATQASSGDTLFLAAGTFGDDEQISLGSKDLQLVGAGPGQTVIVPHPTLTRTIDTGDPNSPTTETYRVVLEVSGSARVDLRDLTLDGDFRTPSGGRLCGAFYSAGADGTLQNVHIINCRHDPLSGAQGPVGMRIRGDGGSDLTEVTARECVVRDFGKGGVVSQYESVLTMEHCRVIGAGPLGDGLPAQNGIQVSRGGRAVLRFNSVSDIRYTPSAWGASGILLYDHGSGVVIEGNRVHECELSIWAIQTSTGTAATYVRGNHVAGADWTVGGQGVTGLVVTNNVLHTVLSDGSSGGAYDDATTGNVWDSNNYTSYSGGGTYAIPGGGMVDSNPSSGCIEIDTPTLVAVGGSPVEMVTADLDATNGIDVVTVNDNPTPSLSVAMNDGSGGYTSTDIQFGNADGRPVAIATGEFDGATGPDVAVLTVNRPGFTSENKVYVFGNTGGTLALSHTETLPSSVVAPNDLAAGELNGDTTDDLAVADVGAFATPGAAHALVNDGTGTAWSTTTLAGSFVTQVQGVAIADLDGDSIADVAATEGDGSTGLVHIWINDGSGALTPLALGPQTVSANPNAIEAGDLDSDGDNDLLVTSIGASAPVEAGAINVLANDLPNGFDTATLVAGRGPAAIAIGDLNDDDDPDTTRRDAAVVNLAGGSVQLLSAFEDAGFTSGSLCGLDGTPRDVAIADVDGDGFGDVLVADAAGLSLLVGRGVPTARVDLYGRGCPGTDDRVPAISAVGASAVPHQPNGTFGIECSDARPYSVAVLNASLQPGPSLGPCEFLLSDIAVTWMSVTDGFGESSAFIPVPNAPPDLQGVSLYFQWAVLDPEGDFLSLASFSPAMRVRIGR